jgi:hypothetical protein
VAGVLGSPIERRRIEAEVFSAPSEEPTMDLAPGTVSKILWHFTGGPPWDEAAKRQAEKPKPTEAAYEALISILKSRELRVGRYREVVRVLVPKIRRFDKDLNRSIEEFNVMREILSDPVCCLTDIPLIHLSYHAERYGRIAIGFRREAVVRHGFNPVFYTLHNTEVLQSIYSGFSSLEDAEYNELETLSSNLLSEIDDLTCENDHAVKAQGSNMVFDLDQAIDGVNSDIVAARKSFQAFLAFVKTFDKGEFGSIYTEREWRSTKSFHFEFHDVAMIVVPRDDAAGDCHLKFVSGAGTIPIPPTVPVVPWEDLIEH